MTQVFLTPKLFVEFCARVFEHDWPVHLSGGEYDRVSLVTHTHLFREPA